VIHGGIFYCAHSNYSGVPIVSSIEMWDAKTLRHSTTWIDFSEGFRHLTFRTLQGFRR
jgi:hypothetical protein